MATLCLTDHQGTTIQQWEIGDRGVIVGRGATVDVQVDDDGLSRRHFMIKREGEDYLLKDLSSRNGTWISGTREFLIRLRNRDRIMAGRSQFRFLDPALQPVTGPHDTVVLSRSSRLVAQREMTATAFD